MEAKLVSSTQIYTDARKLLDMILDITPNFPKAYKFTIGAKMQELGVELIQYITAAYMEHDKEKRIEYLTTFQVKFQTLKALIRIAGERVWIKGRGKQADIIETMDSVGRQSTAWKRSLIAFREMSESGC